MAGENFCGHASVSSPRQECELRYILHGVPILARSACQVRRTCRGRQCVIIQLATTFAYKYLPCVESVFPARALVPAGMHEGVTWTVGRVRHSPTYSVGGSEVGKKWIRSCCRRGGCLLPASSKRLLATIGTISLWARRGASVPFPLQALPLRQKSRIGMSPTFAVSQQRQTPHHTEFPSINIID